MVQNNNKVKQEPKLLALKYVLSLISGTITAGLLVGLIGAVIYHIVSPSDDAASYLFSNGQSYVGLIASLLVFGGIYIVTTFMSGNLHAAKRQHEYIKVLSIVFASFWAIPTVIFLIMAVVSLVGFGVGTADADPSNALAQMIFALSAFVIYLKMIIYHLGILRSKVWRPLYTLIYTALIAAAIALFMIYPGAGIRDAAADEQIVSDLNKISLAIERYAHRNGKLPTWLSDLGSNYNLNHDIAGYKYTPAKAPSDESDGDRTYELCASGFLVDTGVAPYSDSFEYHAKGEQCFSRDVYAFYHSTPIMTDDDASYWLD